MLSLPLKGTLLMVLVTLCVIVDCLPMSRVRQKRGFRQSIVDRMGHGFGKRANTDLFDSYQTKSSPLMSVDEFADNVMRSDELAQAVVRKFIDSDGDGLISTEELVSRIN